MNGTQILNTPGYYYSIAYWLSAFVIICTYRRRFHRWSILADMGALGILVGFMNMTDGIKRPLFIPVMIVVFLFLLGYLYASCDFSWLEVGYFEAKALINAEFAASFCWQIYYNFLGRISTKYLQAWRWTELCLVYGVLFISMYFLERYLKQDMEEIHITRRELAGVLVIAALVFTVSNMSYLDRDWLFSGALTRDIFVIRTLVDMCGVALLYAYHLQVKEVQTRFDRDTLQNIMEMQYQNYKLSQESIDMVNQKYHDLKHQIHILKAESGTQKAEEYLDQMEREIKIYEGQNKTGNRILDTVLTSKGSYCQMHDIELKCVVEGALLNFMDDMDISALFGNMLDNAIECEEKIPEKEKRLIRLNVVKEKQFLRIRIENYCEEKPSFRNGMPVTTKSDKRFHGFGMKSMQKTVEKYGGSVMSGLKNNWFELKILIPLPERMEKG